MRIIDDFENEVKESVYKNKAKLCSVSTLMLRGRNSSDGISIIKLLRASKNKIQFDDLVKSELLKDRNTDFYDFSLLMGQFFGVYNLYSYEFVDKESRTKIVSSNISSEYTNMFFDKYNDKVFEYISYNHSISHDDYINLIGKMFMVVNDYSIYNNSVVKDIGKILMGNYLYAMDYFDGNFENLIDCNEAINYFDNCNKKNRGIVK